MQIKTYVCCLLTLAFSFSKAQTIRGKITTFDNKNVVSANIIVKDSANAIGIKEYTIARNGAFEITLKKDYKNIFVEINANGYSKENYTIKNAQKNQVYENDFLLNKDRVIDIAEIKIVNKRKPYTYIQHAVFFPLFQRIYFVL